MLFQHRIQISDYFSLFSPNLCIGVGGISWYDIAEESLWERYATFIEEFKGNILLKLNGLYNTYLLVRQHYSHDIVKKNMIFWFDNLFNREKLHDQEWVKLECNEGYLVNRPTYRIDGLVLRIIKLDIMTKDDNLFYREGSKFMEITEMNSAYFSIDNMESILAFDEIRNIFEFKDENIECILVIPLTAITKMQHSLKINWN